MSLWAFERNYA